MSTESNKPAATFWIISIIALIWNLLGVSAYLFMAYITDDQIAALPQEQQAEFLIEHPAWYTALFAIAVFGGALGCILLLFRKKAAYILLLASGIAATVQQLYLFATVDLTSYIMPIMVIVVCVILIWYSKKCADDGILN